jgi:hypothetical protein
MRIFFALLIGVPGTFVFGFLAYAAARIGLLSLISALPGPDNASSLPLRGGTVLGLWGCAGFVGLAGFWLWVAQPRALQTYPLCLAVGAAILVGFLALLPWAVLSVLPWPPDSPIVATIAVLCLSAALFVAHSQLRFALDVRDAQ